MRSRSDTSARFRLVRRETHQIEVFREDFHLFRMSARQRRHQTLVCQAGQEFLLQYGGMVSCETMSTPVFFTPRASS